MTDQPLCAGFFVICVFKICIPIGLPILPICAFSRRLATRPLTSIAAIKRVQIEVAGASTNLGQLGSKYKSLHALYCTTAALVGPDPLCSSVRNGRLIFPVIVRL